MTFNEGICSFFLIFLSRGDGSGETNLSSEILTRISFSLCQVSVILNQPISCKTGQESEYKIQGTDIIHVTNKAIITGASVVDQLMLWRMNYTTLSILSFVLPCQNDKILQVRD